MNCILCSNPATPFYEDTTSHFVYFHCPICDLRFLDPARRLDAKQELTRYQLHEAGDDRYLNFVAPLTNLVRIHFGPGAHGLDYGCGQVPALAQRLIELGYQVAKYDFFFHPDQTPLNFQYDFVLSVETAEHFYNPSIEFARFKKLLKPNAALGIMTSQFNSQIDFANWYYRRDPTHVCFYSTKTFEWIKNNFNFTSYVQHEDKVAWLVN